MDLIRNRDARGSEGPTRLAAAMVEATVIAEMRRLIATPEVEARAIEAQRRDGSPVNEQPIISALRTFNDRWQALIPAERNRIVRLLVDRVTIGPTGMAIDLRNNGIAALIGDLTAPTPLEAAE